MDHWMKKETYLGICEGTAPLRFETEIAYFDVFDKPHFAKCSGTFAPEICAFRIDANQEAD